MRPLGIPHTRHAPDSTLPLINIVLLLVLAFMIAGTVDTPLPDGFEPLQSSQAEQELQSVDPTSIVMTQAGIAILSGDRLNETQLRALLTATAKQDRHLKIKADSRAPATKVIELLTTAEDLGVKRAVVMTVETEQ